MAIEIKGISYFTAADLLKQIKVARQTLWRWRQEGKIPQGHRYRGNRVVFSAEEVKVIEDYANRIEAIENTGNSQLGLFNGERPKP